MARQLRRVCMLRISQGFSTVAGTGAGVDTVYRWSGFDSGVEAGSEISTQFDPMIAKVIVHAPTRREAAGRLARVLETTEIRAYARTETFWWQPYAPRSFLRATPPPTLSSGWNRLASARYHAKSWSKRPLLLPWSPKHSGARTVACCAVCPAVGATPRCQWKPSVSIAARSHRCGLSLTTRRSFPTAYDDDEHFISPYECGSGVVDLDDNGRRLQFSMQRHGDNWLVHSQNGDLVLTQQPRYPDTSLDANTGG